MVKTLRGKILLGIVITILLLVSIIDIVVVRVINSKLEDNVKSYMNMMTYIYINEFKNTLILNGGYEEKEARDVFTRRHNVNVNSRDSYIVFRDDEGKEVGFISESLNGKALFEAEKKHDRHKVILTINYEDKTIATYTYPTYINDSYCGTLYIQADFNKEYMDINNMIKLMIMIEVISIMVLITLVYFLLRKLITPIQSLCSYMDKFSCGELVEDIEVTSSREAKYLYDSFNNMKNEINNQINIIKSEKKKVEELQASSKEFFDNVTHEMKTPIAAISGYTQLLIEADLDIETMDRALNRIMIENNRLNKLVTNILDISKGKSLIRKDREIFSLTHILDEILLEFHVRLNKSGLIVDKDMKNVSICGVKDEIRKVIVNLLDNSIKYNGGNEIIVSLHEEEENSVLKIKNPCEYIDEKIKENIFKPFVRYSYNKINVSSTGLGLYICKELVEKNNGNISCEFSEGNICFSVTLLK